MGRILRTDRATADLLYLWIHVKSTQGQAKANTLIRNIERKLRLLSEQPLMGRPRDEYGQGLRGCPAAPYTIFYVPSGDGITVIRVVHGHRDLDSIFDQNTEEE